MTTTSNNTTSNNTTSNTLPINFIIPEAPEIINNICNINKAAHLLWLINNPISNITKKFITSSINTSSINADARDAK